jgi:hypothetical protein
VEFAVTACIETSHPHCTDTAQPLQHKAADSYRRNSM